MKPGIPKPRGCRRSRRRASRRAGPTSSWTRTAATTTSRTPSSPKTTGDVEVDQRQPPGVRLDAVREDLYSENLLYVGTEFGLYASIDRGGSWTRINNNLPTVAVHEVAIHPTAGEIVAATHGRSLCST